MRYMDNGPGSENFVEEEFEYTCISQIRKFHISVILLRGMERTYFKTEFSIRSQSKQTFCSSPTNPIVAQ